MKKIIQTLMFITLSTSVFSMESQRHPLIASEMSCDDLQSEILEHESRSVLVELPNGDIEIYRVSTADSVETNCLDRNDKDEKQQVFSIFARSGNKEKCLVGYSCYVYKE